MAEVLPHWPAPLARLARTDDDGPSELLAMVWGPRFDREQAMHWLTRLPAADTQAVRAMQRFADRFDGLPPAAQRAVREAVAALAHNGACPASC